MMLTDAEINRITFEQWGPVIDVHPAAHRAYARAIIAAHTAKLLAGVEMDWDSLTDNPNQSDIKEWVQQYAAAAAVKARMEARMEALDEAAVEFEGLYSLGGDDIAKCLRQMKGKQV